MKNKEKFDSKKALDFFKNENSFSESPFELKRKIESSIEEINIIDVRNYDDYIEGHIPIAIHIPIESFDDHKNMLEKDKLNIVYCYSSFCKLALKAAIKMSEENYPVMILMGGYTIWKKLGFDCIKTSANTDN